MDPLKSPRDRYFFVKISIFIFGMTSLLPWNLFITANDYWMYKLRNISWDNSNETSVPDPNELQTVFTSYLVIASNVPFVIFLFVNTVLAHRISPTLRITVALGVTVQFFVVTAAVVYVDTDHHEQAFVIGTLASVVIINVAGAFLKGAGTGIAGFLPRDYMNSYVYGQAMGGIFVSVAQILSLVADSSSQSSALAYFLCAVVTLMVTFVTFLGMVRTDFYKFYFSSQIGKQIQETVSKDKSSGAKVPFLKLIKEIWSYALSTVIVFSITLSVFPAVLVLVKSEGDPNSQMNKRFFLPVYCFLFFNVSDILGRIIAAKLPLPGSRGLVELTLSVVRVVFVPIFLLCNGHPRSHLPVVFGHDAYFAVFSVLFGLSNGYIYAVIMAKAPNLVNPEYKETVSSLLAFFLGLGIMIGSVVSYGTIHML